ncbi:unnamed protein product, partial [Hapterophycus canaliculatus]
RVGKILRNSGYQGFVVLEFEEEDRYTEIPIQMERLRRSLES